MIMKNSILLTATVLSLQTYAQDAPFPLQNATTSNVLGTLGSVVSSRTGLTSSTTDTISQFSTFPTDSSSSTSSSSLTFSNSTSSGQTSTSTSISVPLGTRISTSSTSSDAGMTFAPSIVASGNGSGIVIGSFTLTPGGSAFTSGTVSISLASSGILNVDGSTTSLPGASTSEFATSTSTNSASGMPVITSTMTTVPTGVSTELITSSGLTTNTWITTTKDDHSTIVPVIWCPGCGGAVVIWNFPPIPSVLFDWTSVFPKLPKFDLPCVKIFGVHISGDCPNPDTKDDTNDDGDNSSSSESSTTSSSTQSCSAGTTTVTDCRVGCSLSYSTIDSSISSTTVCYTTSCEQTVGCSLQPTTTTSISTSSISGDSCPFAATETYDAVATYSSLGIELPAWMAYPLTYIYSTTDSNTASTNSSTSSTASSILNTTSMITSTSSLVMPTLSSTVSGVGTSSGSTCASTTTFERCNGSGGRSFCETTSSCASWVATAIPTTSTTSAEPTTTSETPTPTPTTALTVHDPVCHNEADFPGHADINPDSVPIGASKFCKANNVDMTPTSAKLSQNYQNIYSVNYLYELKWIEGCTTSDNSQSVDNPVGDDNWQCSDLFQKAYSGCNNGGVGGYVDAGCLRYAFTGGLGDS